MLYKHYLNTDYWKEKRLNILKRDKNKCFFCGSEDSLCVHHLKYMDNNKSILFDEYNCSLITLCKPCHKNFHKLSRKRHYKMKFYRLVKKYFKMTESLELAFQYAKKEFARR